MTDIIEVPQRTFDELTQLSILIVQQFRDAGDYKAARKAFDHLCAVSREFNHDQAVLETVANDLRNAKLPRVR